MAKAAPQAFLPGPSLEHNFHEPANIGRPAIWHPDDWNRKNKPWR